MTLRPPTPPVDAAARRGVKPVIVYPVGTLPKPDIAALEAVRQTIVRRNEVIVPPRDARTFRVKRGQFFRIVCMEGAQVGDLNLWNSNDLTERFFSGKTRALHSTHVSTGDRLWSTMPHLRPMATISHDTLGWYGWDEDGAGVHDVIGTRCDPYTNRLLSSSDYDRCCHSNLSRALATELGDTPGAVEHHIHDVLNVFMCTGFTKDTHQYFMKASPVRAGDFIEFFAERLICLVLCRLAPAAIAARPTRATLRRVIPSRSKFSNRTRTRSRIGAGRHRVPITAATAR